MSTTSYCETSSRLLVISDIHGHHEAMLRLLHEARYTPFKDRLYLLGDYIDADNPGTWYTLNKIRPLVKNGARALLGNQELKLIASLRKRRYRSKQLKWKWLRKLPLYMLDEGLLFVHAGLRPGIPLLEQTGRDLTEIREAFYTQPAEMMMLTERCHTIIFGHTPTFKMGAKPGHVWYKEHLIAIDTGAKHHYRLTLLDLSNGLAYSCATLDNYQYGDVTVATT